MALRAKVLTVSDSVHCGEAEDRGGPAVTELLVERGYDVVARGVVPDGADEVAAALVEMAQGFRGVIATTGGTGFAPRDLTPEGTRQVLEREAPGLGEAMRAVDPRGRLSRGVAGTIGSALVVNLPGSPSGARSCLDAVVDCLPHALALLAGEDPHPHPPRPLLG